MPIGAGDSAQIQFTCALPYCGSVTDRGRSPYSKPSPESFENGIGSTGLSTAHAISRTGSPVTGSLSRFPLSISALSRYVCPCRRTTTSVYSDRFRRTASSLRIIRGRHKAAAADASAARSGTVPTIVPSAVTLPPSCSVRNIAVPPMSAADSRRNGSALYDAPPFRNNGSDSSRKHGSFRYAVRRTGSQNSDSSAYTAPISETPIVGRSRIRTPIHAAARRYTQQFISVLSSRIGSIATFMRRQSPSRSCRPTRRATGQVLKAALPFSAPLPECCGSPVPCPPSTRPVRRPSIERYGHVF